MALSDLIKETSDEEHQYAFLNLHRFPARLDYEQAGWLLGFHPDEIAALVAAEQLHPLGDPEAASHKRIAAVEVEKRRGDIEWLDNASRLVRLHWRRKNDLQKAKKGNNLAGVAVAS